MRSSFRGARASTSPARSLTLGLVIAFVVTVAAACSEDEPSAPAGPQLTDVTPVASEPPDATPEPTAPDVPDVPEPTGADPSQPPPAYRSVSAFDIEAREPTARIAGARGLGGSCETTAECQPGLGCATVIFSGVAQSQIAGGYCSRWCERDSDCSGLDGGGFCAPSYLGSELSFCTRKCLAGEPSGEEKCNGRSDLSCGGYPGIEASCLPRCSADSDCSIGRCSALFGICDATLSAAPRAVIGGRCRTSQPASCNGICSASAAGSDDGVCTGYCRLGSTCGEGEGNVCAPGYAELRVGDSGRCEQSCETSLDCTQGLTACAPTGFLLASGEPQRGCVATYSEPHNLASQRLSREALELATLAEGVINVSTASIFEAVSHRLTVEDGAVCVTGEVIGDFGGLLELSFQMAASNGALFDASAFSAFAFDAEGEGVVRFDAYAPTSFYRLLTVPRAAADIGEGHQRVPFEELIDVFSADDARFEPTRLQSVRFTLIFEDGPGPFRFCVSNFALEAGSSAVDAGP